MKKVRRRVVQRQNEDTNEEQAGHQSNPLLAFETTKTERIAISSQQQQTHNQESVAQRVTHGRRSEILVPSNQAQQEVKENIPNIKTKQRDEASVITVSEIKSSKIAQSDLSEGNKQPEVKGSEDERKNRIELLKQKYLKKTPEIKIQMPKFIQTHKPLIVEAPKIQELAQKPQNIKAKIEQKNNFNIKHEQKQSINVQEHVKIVNSPNKNVPLLQPKQNLQKQLIAAKQDKEAQNSLPQKVEEKKVFKVPPPPTKGGKSKPPPPPVARNYVHQQQEVFVKQHLEINKFQAPDQVVSNVEQQKQVAKSTFVPSPPAKSNKVPPPKSLLVQDILAKKAKRQEVKPTSEEEFKKQNFTQESVNNTIKQKQIEQSEQINKKLQAHNIWVPKENSIQTQQATSFSQQISNWINSPSKNLSNIIYNLDELIHSSSDIIEKDFVFTSKNQGFNTSINGFINEFILKNKSGLSEAQKNATYILSLEYFNTNANSLSTQLLLILIKLGATYISKHIPQALSNLTENICKIILNKSYFNNNQLSTFVDVVLDQNDFNQTQLLHLLLLNANQKLINTISSKNIINIQQIIQILSSIQLVRKENPNIINLYLKFINTLIQNIPDDQPIIQLILKHLNQLQNTEKSYQLHKQIKLKLINLLSNTQKPTRQQARTFNSEPVKQSGDGGLLGYWNKAVDKIKTATTQFAQIKPEKAKPAQQQQQKEEEIIYDPVLKRYLINGKVPEDDSSRPSDPTASKLPPPPPPSKATNKPTPPPLPGKKARVPTNRYA